MKRRILGMIVAAVLAAPSLALAGTWEIDSNHSSVNFKIRHLFTKVDGVFQKVGGTIEFDPANPTTGSVAATIEAASISTRSEKRDGHLKSADFFEVEKYPQITFKSSKVEKRETGLTMSGDLTMHGVTKPVTLDLEFLGSGPHPMPGAQVAGFSATGKLNRKDFGIVWNKDLDAGGTLLGDDVEIRLDIEAVQKPAAAGE